jgi:hypothetical protein
METVYRLYIYFFIPDAMRISMNEMLSFIGMIAAQ